MKKVLISGGWDLMHYNHILVLRYAKTFGDYLVVNVMSDERMRAKKGDGRPLVPLQQRMAILSELRCVDEVIGIAGEGYPLFSAIELAKPNIVLINVTENQDVSDEKQFCAERGIELVEIERLNDGVSTTDLIERWRRAVT